MRYINLRLTYLLIYFYIYAYTVDNYSKALRTSYSSL